MLLTCAPSRDIDLVLELQTTRARRPRVVCDSLCAEINVAARRRGRGIAVFDVLEHLPEPSSYSMRTLLDNALAVVNVRSASYVGTLNNLYTVGLLGSRNVE